MAIWKIKLCRGYSTLINLHQFKQKRYHWMHILSNITRWKHKFDAYMYIINKKKDIHLKQNVLENKCSLFFNINLNMILIYLFYQMLHYLLTINLAKTIFYLTYKFILQLKMLIHSLSIIYILFVWELNEKYYLSYFIIMNNNINIIIIYFLIFLVSI